MSLISMLKLTPEQKANVAKYAVEEHGVVRAIRRPFQFTCEIRGALIHGYYN